MTKLTECFKEFNQTDTPTELIKKYGSLKVQVLKSKELQGADGAQGRVRLTVSDGLHHSQAIINASEIDQTVKADSFPFGEVIELTTYDVHRLQTGKMVFVLHSWKNIGHEGPIGKPTGLEASSFENKPTADVPDSTVSTPTPTPVTPAVAKPKPATTNRPTSAPGFAAILPIEGLSPYHNNWAIRARVSNKSDVRHWTNQRGEGKLFNVTVVDESGEIRATGFGEQVDKFYDLLKEGQAYYISKCRVQIAKKQFSNVQNDFELVFDRDTQIELCKDEIDVPQIKFNFTSINDLSSAESAGSVDLIGILKSISPLEQITSKTTGRPYDKRDVTLVDDSNYSIRATFWGKSATDFSTPIDSVIALKGAKISDFNGRNVSILNSTSVLVDPDIVEAHSLKGWYDGKGKDGKFEQLQPPSGVTVTSTHNDDQRKTIEEVISNQLGMSDKPDYFTIKGIVSFLKKDNMFYPACTQENCNKKVLQDTSGEWRCEKCNVSIPEPKYRYIISMSVSDYTGHIWLSSFDDVGMLILGKSADEIQKLQYENESAFQQILTDALYKEYILRCRARQDTYNEQVGVRYQIVRATPIDFAHESSLLLKKLNI